jgi:nucleoside-diphosphate-sugar epimerase
MAKKKVLLTGASGSMGGEAFKELLRRKDKYDIVLLLRPRLQNRIAFRKYDGKNGVRIVWGNLGNYEDVLKAVSGVDHVLHAAAFISPRADRDPRRCGWSNKTGTENIVRAIKEQPNCDDIRLVSVGSVAEYGDRLPPVHWLKVGDPMISSIGDYYAVTKMWAERAVIESGLKYWAILRQTFIAIPRIYAIMDPIMFHQPLNTHIEIITVEDAGYGLAQTLECPDEFYGRVYNMAGGPSCRVVYSDYMNRFFKIFGMGDFRKVLPRNWFALRNFHCGWYMDTWILNEYLGHWRQSTEDQLKQGEEATPAILKYGGKIAPSSVAKAFMRLMADPVKWINRNDKEKICAFLGSREKWEQIGGWDEYSFERDERDLRVETDPLTKQYTLSDMQELAKSRGGECLSKEYADLKTRMNWKCAFGHEWEATPKSPLTGHWCPECMPPPWKWDEVAKKDPALANIYYNTHDKDESQCVDWLYRPLDFLK